MEEKEPGQFGVIKGGRQERMQEGDQHPVGSDRLSHEELIAAGLVQRRKSIINLANTVGRLLRFDILGKIGKSSAKFPKK